MIQILLKGLTAFAMKLFMAMASEKLIEWGMTYLAREIAKSTKTPHDDALVEKVIEALKDGKK